MLPAPFDLLPPEALHLRRCPEGGVLFAQGDDTCGLWYVHRGSVRLLRRSAAGVEVCLHLAQAGDTLAEASLFAARYHCDAVAAPGTEAVLLRKDQVLRAMATDGRFACAMAQRLAGQVHAGRFRVALRGIRRADDRVLAGLAELGPPDRIADFAAEVGLTPEATYRALSMLVRQGRVCRTGRGRYELAAV